MKNLQREQATLQVFGTHRSAPVNYASGIVGSSALAEDVVQDAWLKLERAGDAEVIRDPLQYLYRVVRNLAIDGRRRTARYNARMGGDMEAATFTAPDEAPSAERAMIANEALDAVMAAIAGLPEKQRIAIELYRFGDFKLREIAEQLDISLSFAHRLIAEGLAQCDRARASSGKK